EELRVLLGIDVVGDHGHVEGLAQPDAEGLGEGGLARAHRPSDADFERLRDHDRNSRDSSSAWATPARSRPGAKLQRSSSLAQAARAPRRMMRGRIEARVRWPSTWPSGNRRSAAFTSSAVPL